MIPLALVAGFLGSGKTTFLRRAATLLRSRRIVFLVNEFSPRDVDGALLREAAANVVSIPGGSIFCRCLVSEFIDVLANLPGRFGAEGRPVEGVIVEASGMADPRVLPALLRETRQDASFRLAAVVAIVDPKSFVKLVHTLPAVRAQVEAAGWVLINKTDIAAPEEIAAAEAIVREIAPAARIVRTVACAADVDLFGRGAEARPSGRIAPCVDPSFGRLHLRFEEGADVEDLRRRLAGLGEDLLRAKGFVPAGGRLVLVDVSASGVNIGGPAPAGAVPELSVIVRGASQRRAAAALSGIPHAALEA